MPGQFSFPSNTGSFIPISNVWDPSQIYSTDLDPQLKEILVRMYQNLNLMAINVNIKDSGYYNSGEFVNGQLFFPNPANNSASTTSPSFRQVFRTTVNFGALPNNAVKSVPHYIPITKGYTFTRIYATASDTTGLTYIPIPNIFPSVDLNVDATNVNITTFANLTNYNFCYAILEYIKS